MFLELEKLAPKIVPLLDNITIIDSNWPDSRLKHGVEEQPVDFGRPDLLRSGPSKTRRNVSQITGQDLLAVRRHVFALGYRQIASSCSWPILNVLVSHGHEREP
jgi:hypothetical protein